MNKMKWNEPNIRFEYKRTREMNEKEEKKRMKKCQTLTTINMNWNGMEWNEIHTHTHTHKHNGIMATIYTQYNGIMTIIIMAIFFSSFYINIQNR